MIVFATRVLRRAAQVGARNATRAGTAFRRAEAVLTTEAVERERMRRAMISWDGLGNLDERYYTERLLAWLDLELTRREGNLAGEFLDLGCGPGRLLLPLAERLRPHGGRITGIVILAAATKA
jgi:SAM-dependent methyltransferase